MPRSVNWTGAAYFQRGEGVAKEHEEQHAAAEALQPEGDGHWDEVHRLVAHAEDCC